MSRSPKASQVEAALKAAQVAADVPAKELATRLLADPEALLGFLEHAKPDVSPVPDIDQPVETALRRLYGGKVDNAALLEKKKRVGMQNRLVLAKLLERPGEWITLRELLLANGLSTDTPKRLRELRTEHGGWQVEQKGTGRTSRYRLVSASPDYDASARWWLMDNIRQSKLGSDERILTLIKSSLGKPVPLEDIRHVNPATSSAGKGRMRQAQSETTRRVRELREEGWQVYSGLDKVVAGLASSEYIMLTLDRLPPYERIKPKVWLDVIKRDKRTCQDCGWSPAAGLSRGRKCLEVHHRTPQKARPEDVNDPNNLVTLCNVCHDAQ